MGDETIEAVTERLLETTGRGPFHVRDGLYVWRDREGVHVALTGAPGLGALREHRVVDPDGWASAVASTTWDGETGVTFRVVRALLG